MALRKVWLLAGIKIQYFDKGILIDALLKALVQFGLVYYFWRAVFSNAPVVVGRDFDTFVVYLVLSLYVQLLISYPNIHFIGRDIRSGAVVNALVRPMDYGVQVLYKNIGIACVNALLYGPLVVLFVVLQNKGDVLGATAFIVLAILGVLTAIQFDCLMGYLTFWTENSWGIALLKSGLFMFFTGRLFPVDMLGVFAYKVVRYSPFPGMVFTPVNVFLKGGEGFLEGVIIQCFWLAVLTFTAKGVFYKAQKDVSLNGG